MLTPLPPHDDTGLTSGRDARAEWFAERQAHAEQMAATTDPVIKCRIANVQESFERLGNLLHAIERQLREVVEGTWEERELCFQRFSNETHDLATQAAEVVAEFKRQVYAEAERYKELNQ